MENKREFFRVDLYGIYATIVLPSEKIEPTYKGKVRDVSGAGVSILVENDVPLPEGTYIRISFEIEGFSFSSDGSIVRKQENKYNTLYGVRFEHISEEKRSQLAAVLLRIDALKRKK